MKSIICIVFILISSVSLFAQNCKYEELKQCESDTIDGEEVFLIVEKMPKYEGGIKKFYKDFSKNFTIKKGTPFDCTKIYLSFIIDKNSNIKNACCSKNLELNDQLINSINHWSVGIQNGEKVPVRLVIPIRITLR